MKALAIALGVGCAALCGSTAARAEPVTLSVFNASSGVAANANTFSGTSNAINLGTITLDGGSSALIYVQGLGAWTNVPVTFNVVDPSGSGFTTLTAELLDPLSDGRHGPQYDPDPEPSYVPAGYSTSNNHDGLSFAWNAGLARSATFAGGGSANLSVDEDSNARDLLAFHGFTGGSQAAVTFGLRDDLGNRGFLIRLSVDGDPANQTAGDPGASATPEPASMLLLGTGLVGLVYGRRRRA